MSDKVKIEIKPYSAMRILAILQACQKRWPELDLKEQVREFHQELVMKMNNDLLDDAQIEIQIQEILKNN